MWPNAEAFRSRRKGCRCESCHADQPSLSELLLGRPIWNVNRTSEPGLGANECVLLMEDVAQVHGIPPVFGGRAQAPACSSKRTVRPINGIALDECRARERYPARRPAFAPSFGSVNHFSPPSARSSKSSALRDQAGKRDRPEVFARVAQALAGSHHRGTTSRASPVSVRI